MRSKALLLASIPLMIVAIGFTRPESETEADKPPRLPGARPIIQAEDYASLQDALDALPAEGGAVRLPPGVFELDRPLRLSAEDVLLEGAGTATHIKNVNTDGQPAIVIEPPKNKKSIWRIRLSNFRLTGNPESGHGLVARQVDEIFIHGITVSYHGGHGILLDHCYEDPRICNSLITYNKQTGLALEGCHDIVVCGNQFEENLDALTCIDGFNLCMNGNCLDDHIRNGVVIENTYGSVVSGNMIEECQGTAIILDRDCYGITLSANVIAHDSGGGIDLRDAHGCTVSANTFTIVPQRGLSIGPESGRITVTGNNFSDSFIGGSEKRSPNDQAASGLVLSGTSDVNVTGNLFSGLDQNAVSFGSDDTERILVNGNIFTQAGPGPRSTAGVTASNNLQD